ncbi:MAG: DUF2505 domain-containing protein [Actinomycetes bacterium]
MQIAHRYDLTPTGLLAVLVDPAFLAARSARYGGVGSPMAARAGDELEVRTVRQLPLDRVPGPFRRFVGDGRVEQVDVWPADGGPDEGVVTGRWWLETGRAPIDLNGRHLVTADGAGCSYVASAEIRVSVPVVAGRLSRQVESYLGQLITAEQKFLAEWLAA